MKYMLVGALGTGMYSLSRILIKNHYIEGIDDNNLDVDFKIHKFKDFKYDKSFIYIISNAYDNYLNILKDYKCFLYHDFIAKYFKDYNFICVAGSHGKTTTSSFLSHVLDSYSHIIGAFDGYLGNNNLILEACEYKNSFLSYSPDILLILNIDYDHFDFFKTKDDYINSFKLLIKKSKIVIINKDSFNINNLICYSNNDFKYDYNYVYFLNRSFKLPIKGINHAYNFFGAYIVLKLLNISDDLIKDKLKTFKLPIKRLEEIKYKNKTIIFDYAHHPNELKSLYDTISNTYDSNYAFIFQPHTLSRIKHLEKEFNEALGLFKNVYLYKPFIPNNDLLIDISLNYEYCDIFKIINDFDLIFLVGAGDIYDEFKKLKYLK